MLERVSDGCRRQRHVALSQSHQGQARLRIPPRLAGARGTPPPHLEDRPAAVVPVPVRSMASRTPAAGTVAAPHTQPGPPARPRWTPRAVAGSRHGGPGSGHGCCRHRFRGATAPWPRSTPRPGRTGRAPGACRPARSRPSRSRWRRVHRRWWPPPPPRPGPGPDGPRPPRSPHGPGPPDPWRPPQGCSSIPSRSPDPPIPRPRARRPSSAARSC